MSEMVERVMKAIDETIRLDAGFDIINPEEVARAAIEAVREPTPRMYDDAASALYRLYFGDGGFIGAEAAKEQARVTHHALIDAALKE